MSADDIARLQQEEHERKAKLIEEASSVIHSNDEWYNVCPRCNWIAKKPIDWDAYNWLKQNRPDQHTICPKCNTDVKPMNSEHIHELKIVPEMKEDIHDPVPQEER